MIMTEVTEDHSFSSRYFRFQSNLSVSSCHESGVPVEYQNQPQYHEEMDSLTEMTAEIEAPSVHLSLELLDEYWLMDIFELLHIDDLINVSKTCKRLRFTSDRIFKVQSKFLRLDLEMINKGEEYIEHLFRNVGRYVTFLDFDGCEHRNLSKILGKISKSCKNLKTLKCSIDTRNLCDGGVPPAYNFDNVEELILFECDDKFTEHFTKNFFESFHRLKSVDITFSSIEPDELKTIFQNNRSIENLVCGGNGSDFNLQLLQLIPNVQRLCLIGEHMLELDSLLKLNRLTKLKLDCENLDINNFLRRLATKGIIEEMDLGLFTYDDDTFDTLASFSKLKLLVLYDRTSNVKLKSSIAWPAQLKKLRLLNFMLTKNDLIAMIRQLESIESICIGECIIAEHDIHNFNDVAKLSQNIRYIIYHSSRKQRLDVVLPKSVEPADPSKKYLIESARLRILCNQSNQYDTLRIEINFSGAF